MKNRFITSRKTSSCCGQADRTHSQHSTIQESPYKISNGVLPLLPLTKIQPLFGFSVLFLRYKDAKENICFLCVGGNNTLPFDRFQHTVHFATHTAKTYVTVLGYRCKFSMMKFHLHSLDLRKTFDIILFLFSYILYSNKAEKQYYFS